MKDGGTAEAPAQVTSAAKADANTIDVEAKNKS
jgi:hypothetical protein